VGKSSNARGLVWLLRGVRKMTASPIFSRLPRLLRPTAALKETIGQAMPSPEDIFERGLHVDQCDCINQCGGDDIRIDRNGIVVCGILHVSGFVDIGDVIDIGGVVFAVGGRKRGIGRGRVGQDHRQRGLHHHRRRHHNDDHLFRRHDRGPDVRERARWSRSSGGANLQRARRARDRCPERIRQHVQCRRRRLAAPLAAQNYLGFIEPLAVATDKRVLGISAPNA